jgi:NEDD8-activating enzyme E1
MSDPRWKSWQRIYSTATQFGNETGQLPNGIFEPNPNLLESLQNDAKVLVVGAGGLGCEILKVSSSSIYKQICIFDDSQTK